VDTPASRLCAELSALADVVLGPGGRRTGSLVELDAPEPDAPEPNAPEPDAQEPGAEPLDLVLAAPDDVPRLHHQARLLHALTAACRRLRPGGLLLAPALEPAELREMHAFATVPVTVDTSTWSSLQVWDFSTGAHREYTAQQLTLQRTGKGWRVLEGERVAHRIPTLREMTAALTDAGYLQAQRLSVADTGLSIAIWAEVAPAHCA